MKRLSFEAEGGFQLLRHVKRALLMVFACLWYANLSAQGYPSKTVTIIVPYTAGGPTDAFFRALADGLGKEWSQAVIIENKPGANEIIGAMATVRAPKDGYTIMGANEATTILNPLLHRKLAYNPQTQLTPISLLAKGPLVLVVPATMPVRNLKEFIQYAKERGKSNPVTYGTTGMGGTPHLSFAAFQKQNGIVMTQVNYPGVVNVVQDILSGNLEAGVVGPSLAEGHVKSGKLRALAIPFARASSLPDVPTFEEAGFADMKAAYELTLVAPAGTPPEVISKIAADAKKVLYSADFQKKNVEPFGLVSIGSSPAEFADYLKSEREIRRKLVVDSGVEIQD